MIIAMDSDLNLGLLVSKGQSKYFRTGLEQPILSFCFVMLLGTLVYKT